MTKLKYITLLASFTAALIISSSNVLAVVDIDTTPSWYNGKKPWSSISRSGREEILSIRRKYETDKAKANEPSNQQISPSSVNKGEHLIGKTLKQYSIDSFYKTPSIFGSRMVIWLPEKAWNKYSPEQKASIELYMKSKYKNWGIGVGRVSGVDIMADRLVVEH
jgi:hypothetical protein